MNEYSPRRLQAILVYGFMHVHEFVGLTEYDLGRLSTFPLFFGVAAFLLCTHGMVIPMEQSLAEPKQMFANACKCNATQLNSRLKYLLMR
jgi:hypothetical protein